MAPTKVDFSSGFYVNAVKSSIRKCVINQKANSCPMAVRLAWHASGTYSKEDKTGGSNGATMRFEPESADGANAGLDIERSILEPVKREFPELSYADIWTLASPRAPLSVVHESSSRSSSSGHLVSSGAYSAAERREEEPLTHRLTTCRHPEANLSRLAASLRFRSDCRRAPLTTPLIESLVPCLRPRAFDAEPWGEGDARRWRRAFGEAMMSALSGI